MRPMVSTAYKPSNPTKTSLQSCNHAPGKTLSFSSWYTLGVFKSLRHQLLADSPPLPVLPSLHPRPLPSRPDFILCKKRGKIREVHKLKCDGAQPNQETVK